MAGTTFDLDTAADVLAAARASKVVEDAEAARQLRLAVAWAAMHSVDSIADAAWAGDFGDMALPIAGEGAPLVAEFCIPEFAAAVGLPTDAGRAYLGEALELRHRLPRLWQRVVAGDLPAWRARRVARATLALSLEAAAFVDRHVAHVAHQIRPATVDRLVEEATARFMPDTAEQARRDGRGPPAPRRRPPTGLLRRHQPGLRELDLADALDLDAALRGIAGQLGDLGCGRVVGRAAVDGRRGTRPPPTRPRPHHPADRSGSAGG